MILANSTKQGNSQVDNPVLNFYRELKTYKINAKRLSKVRESDKRVEYTQVSGNVETPIRSMI